MRLNSKQIALYTGGQFIVEPIDASAIISNLTWDSREIKPGDLFVALPGERVDGHQFVAQVLQAGAACVLVMMRPDEATCLLASEMGAAIIEVSNTHSAITDLARAWRGFLRGRVIALTGSTGKTTTKNLVRDVLASKLNVVATVANQNNELGVPRTLLAANPETDAVVVEMGMRGFKQIEQLCEFVRPDWGLIINVGEAHIELLGSRANIASAKAEIFDAVPQGTGRVFINALDDYALDIFQKHVADRSVAVSLFNCPDEIDLAPYADTYDWRVWASDVNLDGQGRPHFILHAVHGDYQELDSVSCSLNLRGLHNVSDACAAAAVACACGMELADIASALSSAEPEAGRAEVIAARGGFTVINDAYNANPDSMRASLLTFASMSVSGQKIAVLGDMGELGDYAYACHRGVGELCASLPLDCVICVGELAQHIADAALEAGMDPDAIVRATTNSDVLGELDIRLNPGDAVLCKASHAAELTRVVEGLIH